MEKQQILNEYCKNEMVKLKQFCYPKICKIGGISQMDYDDLYSIALDVLRDSVERFDNSQDCQFTTFLNNNLQNKFDTYVRDQNRGKRKCPGKMEYFDAPTEDGVSLTEKFCSNFCIEDNLSDEVGFSSDEKVDKFFSKLGTMQRNILKLLMQGYNSLEVKEKLDITDKEYSDAMSEIRKNKHLSLFDKKSRENKLEVLSMTETNVLDVMEIDTTDSYRMDKYSLLSLLDKKSDGEIDCNYISQRAPFQWDTMRINKFYTRVLNNQPIPEIIICETTEDGEKIAYLIDGLQRLSYAEWFKENRIKIGARGAEFTNIKYRKYETDENGNKILDDKGRAKYEIDTFDVVGKYYRDLPEFLQKRFNDFNVNVTTFFNCTEEIIDYHIRNYNNHCSMTKSQYGITNVNNFTSKNIKLISEEHDFFKDIITCTFKNKTKGMLEEVVARSIVALNFLTDWKKEVLDTLLLVNEKATDEHYKNFRELLDKLYNANCETVKTMFTTTNAPIWFVVFDKFSKLGKDDSEFVRFMENFKESIDRYKKNKDDKFEDVFVSKIMYETFTNKGTKDKAVVQNKINSIYNLLLEFLHIDTELCQIESEIDVVNNITTKPEEEISVLDFVKENVKSDVVEEDVFDYLDDLEVLTLEVDCNSKLLEEHNRNSIIAMIAYGYKNDITLDEWFIDFFERNSTYINNQKENYLHMKKDLKEYLRKNGVAA